MKRDTVLLKRSIGCLVSDVASGSEEKTTASVFGMYIWVKYSRSIAFYNIRCEMTPTSAGGEQQECRGHS